MDMRELKTLLKFQNIELSDEAPAIRRVRKVRSSASKSVSQRRPESEEFASSMGKIPIIDLGGGDTFRVLKKATPHMPSSESFNSGFTATTQPTTSHLSSSVMSIADDHSRKASLKSFPEVKTRLDRPTYASCFIKRSQNFRSIMDVLREGRPSVSESQVYRSTWENKRNEERGAVRKLDDKEEPKKEKCAVVPLPQTSGKSFGDSYHNVSSNTDEDLNYDVSEDTSEESEFEESGEEEDEEEEDPYERAKEMVLKMKGKVPDSEDEYTGEEDDEEGDDESAVFHYRPTRLKHKGRPRPPPPPPRGSYVSNKHLTIEKTKEAKFAEVAAMRANESLRRARSLFREISPLRRMSNETTPLTR